VLAWLCGEHPDRPGGPSATVIRWTWGPRPRDSGGQAGSAHRSSGQRTARNTPHKPTTNTGPRQPVSWGSTRGQPALTAGSRGISRVGLVLDEPHGSRHGGQTLLRTGRRPTARVPPVELCHRGATLGVAGRGGWPCVGQDSPVGVAQSRRARDGKPGGGPAQREPVPAPGWADRYGDDADPIYRI
jgi:hypothetical protein